MSAANTHFRSALLQWGAAVHRPMPWKGERDPYKIWLSEIILQQTRVEQGLPYYLKFVEQFPDVKSLADAPEETVFKCWEGLGYYSRARNLHQSAKQVAYTLSGVFPDTFEGLRALKGVGDYTAAAIASFAYDQPHAVLDGNVYRILSRYFGIETAIDLPEARKKYGKLAQDLLADAPPAAYNQAIMDFGALQCVPKNPNCGSCPLAAHCVALAQARVGELPRKEKKLLKRTRHFCYFVFNVEGNCWVQRRSAADIWQDLFEFPQNESEALPENRAEAQISLEKWLKKHKIQGRAEILHCSGVQKQTLTHQYIRAVFCEIQGDEALGAALDSLPELRSSKRADLKKNFSFPKILDKYLEEYVSLSLF
ncbi:MAG: A/G-specific adenine glycosylase [Chitinophagales bacterium]|nr:A/G-specific adenine glycosylase [Chitinophagales bacterium]